MWTSVRGSFAKSLAAFPIVILRSLATHCSGICRNQPPSSRVFGKHHQTGQWEEISGASVCQGRPSQAGIQICAPHRTMATRQSKSSGSIVAEAWYLLAQQKELLVTPLDPDDVLPMQPPFRENAADTGW